MPSRSLGAHPHLGGQTLQLLDAWDRLRSDGHGACGVWEPKGGRGLPWEFPRPWGRGFKSDPWSRQGEPRDCS